MGNNKVENPVTIMYEKNIDFLKNELAVDANFDVVHLELDYGERQMSLFLVDGFGKDQAITQIQRELIRLKPTDLEGKTLDKLMKRYIPYAEIESTDDLDHVVDQVLAGPAALVVEGIDEVILIDTREYPIRGPEEPDTEKVIRGSKDGFVETLVMNAALLRRRIRDRTMRVEYISVGRRSKSDLAISYIGDIADPSYVKEIKQALENIDTDGLSMGDKTIEEFIFGHHNNPYPMVRYTERPDVAASHLFEGHVIIMVDGSPSVMITPTTFWHHMQHAEEYRQKPIVGTSLRIVRYAAVWASLFLLPLWYLLATREGLAPPALNFIGAQEEGTVPLYAQFIIAEIGIEMLRMAAIHTPNALATALGLVAALLIGEVAINVGVFSPEVVLYLAVAAVGTFATPSYEMSLANRLIRVALLISTALFGVPGFVVGVTAWLLMLVHLKSLGTPYMWPFLPFNALALKDVLLRTAMPLKKQRPQAIHPNDPDR
ncbi:stage V sporulation protein AF [Halalkalibacter wakoensis JCM 9140]|uniref:Stage V sporulation protein AF n=1 Tax=Halalkalibacter wakoensis JCM 9140 TaxID=1236970 RepID=W4PYG4_9BACI|nr:spore germination protein [Halalkalibacter wakoensis]GAE24772.1 stage V sporulation protein AF [Halalkalibacter wakoensis JCM 9140]